MRQLGTLNAEADARCLVDYLLTQGIAARVDPDNGAWAVWVHHEDQLDKARGEFTEFQANPTAERYQQASRAAAQVRRDESRRDAAARKNYIDLRRRWDVRGSGNTPLTWTLIVASIWVVFQLGFAKGNVAAFQSLFIAELQLIPGGLTWSLEDHLRRGEIWRLITPIFIHIDFVHLLFNMMWMYDLGRRVESLVGTWRYLLLVLVAAVIPNIAQLEMSGPVFGGMSGVVYALIGYAWVQYRYGSCTMLFLGPGAMFMAVAWLVLGFMKVLGPMGNWAHLAGLAVGMAAGYLPIWWQRLRRR